MKHTEAIAIKIYYEAIAAAHENNIQLTYNSGEEEFYKSTLLNMKTYDHLINFMYFDNVENTNEIKKQYIDIMVDFLEKLEEVQTGRVSVR